MLTNNLKLFKYDLETDGKQVFDINKALNNNWDILDQNIGVIDKATMGTTWYRKYQDGFKMMGGLATLEDTELPWTQPAITSNGIMGGSTFAVEGWSDSNAYMLFNGKDDISSNKASSYVKFYNPVPLIVTSIKGRGVYSNWSTSKIVVQASNDNYTWTDVGIQTGVTNSPLIEVDTNGVAYNYYKYNYTAYENGPCYYELVVTATQKFPASNKIIFPIAFQNIDYSYSFAFQDETKDAYVSEKLTTGMNLANRSSAQASWIAMGY